MRDRAPWSDKPSNKWFSRICVQPPTKEVLYEKLLALEKQHNIDLGMTRNKMPDRGWMLDAIASLNEDDEIFEKNYRPEIKPRANKYDPIINNDDGLFTGLPVQRHLCCGKNTRVSIFTSEQKTNYEIGKTEHKLAQMAEKLAALKEKKARQELEKAELNFSKDAVRDMYHQFRAQKQLIEEMDAKQKAMLEQRRKMEAEMEQMHNKFMLQSRWYQQNHEEMAKKLQQSGRIDNEDMESQHDHSEPQNQEYVQSPYTQQFYPDAELSHLFDVPLANPFQPTQPNASTNANSINNSMQLTIADNTQKAEVKRIVKTRKQEKERIRKIKMHSQDQSFEPNEIVDKSDVDEDDPRLELF
jgi:hypothetical protein